MAPALMQVPRLKCGRRANYFALGFSSCEPGLVSSNSKRAVVILDVVARLGSARSPESGFAVSTRAK